MNDKPQINASPELAASLANGVTLNLDMLGTFADAAASLATKTRADMTNTKENTRPAADTAGTGESAHEAAVRQQKESNAATYEKLANDTSEHAEIKVLLTQIRDLLANNAGHYFTPDGRLVAWPSQTDQPPSQKESNRDAFNASVARELDRPADLFERQLKSDESA